MIGGVTRPSAATGQLDAPGSVEGHDEPHGIVAEAIHQGLHHGEHMWPVRSVAQDRTGSQRLIPALEVPTGPLRGLSRMLQFVRWWANRCKDFRGH